MSDYAIVIGVNHYTPPKKQGLKSLKGAIEDAESIANWLQSNAGVPRQNIKLLTSVVGLKRVIKNDVDTTISSIVKEVATGDADRLYFYFAGHGMGVENDSENNGLCLSNWDEFMFDVATISSIDYKRKFVTEGFFKEVVIWLDCCRNTKIRLNPGMSSGVNFRGKYRSPKFFVGFATTYENQAYESSYTPNDHLEPRGIFTKILLEGLNGAAKRTDGRIDAESLSGYLYKNVPIEAAKWGFSQDPEIYHNTNQVKPMFFV